MGESTYLLPSDRSIVVCDGAHHAARHVESAVGDGAEDGLAATSGLRQVVVDGSG